MQNLLIGIEAVFTLQGILAIVIGCAIGIVVGALPGLGPSLGVALLIPATYALPPSVAFNLLVSLYLAAEYGGSITAILLGAPGTASATAMLQDGYSLNKQGKGVLALQTLMYSATIGGVVGGIALMTLSLPLVTMALKFGPPEYFALGIFGLSLVASLSGDNLIKGLVAATLGLLIVVVGIDSVSGTARYTFGFYQLFEGVPFLVVLIGVFAVAECFAMLEGRDALKAGRVEGSARMTLGQFRSLIPSFGRGSLIGVVVGVLPGAGANIASWLAYDQEKRWSRTPERFGKGAIEGVAGPETAGSASVGGSLVPLLTLGIPGSPTAAVLLGALTLHGLQPGPKLFEGSPDVVYGLFVGLVVAYVAIYVLGTVAMPVWRRVLSMPNAILAPGVFVLSMIAAFSVRNLMFDVWLALGFGLVGYVLKKLQFPMAPLILAMVLGVMVEANYSRSLIMAQGSHDIFFSRPLAASLLAVALAVLVWPLISAVLRRRRST